MRDDLPSITALLVAAARAAVEIHPLLREQVAKPNDATRAMLPARLASLLPRRPGRRAHATQVAARLLSFGLVDHMALRTAAIDAIVEDAVKTGATQLVVLGAGFDVRAYRLASLSNVTVFELDHPATQRGKRARIEDLRPTAKRIDHVALDLTQRSFLPALAASGYDANTRSVWICEGVTNYLPTSATRHIIEQMAEGTCAGSAIAVSYLCSSGAATTLRLGGALLGAVGEPFRGSFTQEAMGTLAEDSGFAVISDRDDQDCARSLGGSPALATLFRAERILHARRL